MLTALAFPILLLIVGASIILILRKKYPNFKRNDFIDTKGADSSSFIGDTSDITSTNYRD